MPRVRFGSKSSPEYIVPDITDLVKSFRHETIFTFGTLVDNDKYRWCVGVGRVTYVEKGDKLDLVKMNFGGEYSRRIYVSHNHARRQIYSLVKGQLAWFIGYYRCYRITDGDEKKPLTVFFAKGFQPWYVPKALDIKNFNSEDLEKMKEEDEESMLSFLDDILKED